MRKLVLFFVLMLGTSCLPHPSTDIQKATPELLIRGQVVPSSAAITGRTLIFIETAADPEILAAEDGSFEFTLAESRFESLRWQFGWQNRSLRLYFVSENGAAESALVAAIDTEARGIMDLGVIQMQPEVAITGRVIGNGGPLAEARVRIGRKELLTDGEGLFTTSAPLTISTPLLIEKAGFVQTKGSWTPGDATRDIQLYRDLTPYGTIEALPRPRDSINSLILLNFSATTASQWIRFGSRAEDLAKLYEPNAPWLDLGKTLALSPQFAAAAGVYYQFADQNQKILSPVLRYDFPTVSE